MTAKELVLILLALTAIAGIGYLIFFYIKKAKEENIELGVYVANLVANNSNTIIFLLILAFSISEALFAAFLSMQGEHSELSFPRLILHFSMAAASIVGGLSLSRSGLNISSSFSNKTYGKAFVNILLFIVHFCLLVFPPLFNLLAIAQHLNEVTLLEMLLISFGLGDYAMWDAKVEMYGLDPSSTSLFDLFKKTSGFMTAVLGLYVCHYLFIMVELLSLFNYRIDIRKSEQGKAKNGDGKKDAKSNKEEDKSKKEESAQQKGEDQTKSQPAKESDKLTTTKNAVQSIVLFALDYYKNLDVNKTVESIMDTILVEGDVKDIVGSGERSELRAKTAAQVASTIALLNDAVKKVSQQSRFGVESQNKSNLAELIKRVIIAPFGDVVPVSGDLARQINDDKLYGFGAKWVING